MFTGSYAASGYVDISISLCEQVAGSVIGSLNMWWQVGWLGGVGLSNRIIKWLGV